MAIHDRRIVFLFQIHHVLYKIFEVSQSKIVEEGLKLKNFIQVTSCLLLPFIAVSSYCHDPANQFSKSAQQFTEKSSRHNHIRCQNHKNKG